MPKVTFDYESKQLARQKLVNFVIKHYPKSQRRQLTMVCLPGAQALDVYRISDTLKIPRKNVTGIEMNRRIYKTLEKMNLGINLFLGTDNEFLRETDDQFDIVSLDYFGQIKRHEIDALRYLFGREVLKPKGVLHTNFYGSREAEPVKKIYRTDSFLKAFADAVGEKPLDEVRKGLKNGTMRKKLEETLDENVIEIAGLREGLTRAILKVAGKGRANLETDDLEKILYSYDVLTERLESSGVPYYLALYVSSKQNRPYFCDSLERYKYISDDGSPMLTDIFLFNQHREWFDDKEYPVAIDSSDSEKLKVRIGDNVFFSVFEHVMSDHFFGTPLERKVLKKAFNVTYHVTGARSVDIVKERLFLGSSYKRRERPPKLKIHEKSILTKEEAIRLLKEGRTPAWIAENYSGMSVYQLRAYKAWITMGKY